VTGTSGSEAETTSVCAEVSNSSATCSSAASKSGIFYVLTSSSIAGYTVSTNGLVAISGASYNLTGASAIAISPSGSFLYATTEQGIILFSINSSTGALTLGTSGIGDTAAAAIQVDPTGKWLLDANLAGTLTAYPITSTGTIDSTRTLPPITQLASATIEKMAISPNGLLISVALGLTGTQVFPFNAANNTAPISNAYNFGSNPYIKPYGPTGEGTAISVAFDPQSRLMYIGETSAFPNSNTNSGGLRVFIIGTNSLAEFSYNQPYAPLGTGPHAILPDSTGKYVYVASWVTGADGEVSGYSVATSALTPIGSPVATGTEPYGLVEDSTESYVMAVSNAGSPLFNAYTFDNSTLGQLDTSTTGSTASNPIAIAAIPAAQ
jgi:6-phosphogluconolactonase (cycloisomerase 2 family)